MSPKAGGTTFDRSRLVALAVRRPLSLHWLTSSLSVSELASGLLSIAMGLSRARRAQPLAPGRSIVSGRTFADEKLVIDCVVLNDKRANRLALASACAQQHWLGMSARVIGPERRRQRSSSSADKLKRLVDIDSDETAGRSAERRSLAHFGVYIYTSASRRRQTLAAAESRSGRCHRRALGSIFDILCVKV